MLFQARMNDDDLLEFNEENFNEIKHFEQNDTDNALANNIEEEGEEDEDENEIDMEYLDRHEHGKHRGISHSASIKRHNQQASSNNINTFMQKKPRLVDPAGAMGGNLKSKRTKIEPTSSASFEFAGHGSSMSNAAASLSANAIKNEDLLSFATSGTSVSNPIKKIERRHNLALLALKVNSDIDYIQSNAAKVAGKMDDNSSDGGEDDAISPVNEKRLHPILFENMVSSKQRTGDAIKPSMQMQATASDPMASYSPNDNNLLPGIGSLKSLKQKLDDQADEQSAQETRRIAAVSSKSKKEPSTTIFKPSSLFGGIGVSSSANKPSINNQINMNKYYSMFKTVDTGELVEQTGIPNVAMLLGEPQGSSLNSNNESYNFLNIYRKRGGSVPSSVYILNVINKRKQLNNENKIQPICILPIVPPMLMRTC